MLASLPWLLAIAAAPATYDPGLYRGQILIPTATVALTLTLQGRLAEGMVDLPEQGLVRYPISELHVDGDALRFALPGIPGEPRFTLAWKRKAFEGIYSQGRESFAVTLAPVPATERLDEALRGADQVLADALAAADCPGLAYVVAVGGARKVGAIGLRDREAKKNVTPDTPFRLGMLTRSLVRVAVAQRIESSTWRWDDRVSDVMPAFRIPRPDSGLGVTIAQLLQPRAVAFAPHSVAVRSMAGTSPAEALQRLRGLPLASTPSSTPWPTLILSLLLATPAGSADGSSAITRAVLAPFALDVAFEPSDAHAQGYRRFGRTVVKADPPRPASAAWVVRTRARRRSDPGFSFSSTAAPSSPRPGPASAPSKVKRRIGITPSSDSKTARRAFRRS